MSTNPNMDAAYNRYSLRLYKGILNADEALVMDMRDLADAYVSERRAAESIAKDMLLPMDGEWLLSIGFDFNNAGIWDYLTIKNAEYELRIKNGRIYLARGKKTFTVGWVETTTRGMMLAFLKGIGVEVK